MANPFDATRTLTRAARATAARPLQRLQPRSAGRVVFNSFTGSFSDSPRAIHEELVRRSRQLEHTWIATEPVGRFPDEVRTVTPFSLPYLREVGRAKYVVSNVHMPRNFRKTRDVVYLQTWHGTPLKKIGYDNPRWVANSSGFSAAARDSAHWDYIVTQNRFSTEIFRRAFRYEGEILETGYPRNDILSSPRRDELRQAIRRRLGLSADHTAVLYAPTWRDNLVDEHGRLGFSLKLDAAEMSRKLGTDHVLLLRLHYLVANRVSVREERGVVDVSAYPDIRDLYLAADVLITDYSSAMFDFAVTGKPMVFFTYDLESYRDNLRGFYFALEDEAPGPLCSSTEEVISVLRDIQQVQTSYDDRYRRFRARFCALEDGMAARRVVDRVFTPAFRLKP